MASAAISQLGAGIRSGGGGGALGVARARDLGLMAVETVGAEAGMRIDPGPRVHVARMRELGEKLSGQAGIRQQSGRVRGDVTLLADSRIVRGAKGHRVTGDALRMPGAARRDGTGLDRHGAGAAFV